MTRPHQHKDAASLGYSRKKWNRSGEVSDGLSRGESLGDQLFRFDLGYSIDLHARRHLIQHTHRVVNRPYFLLVSYSRFPRSSRIRSDTAAIAGDAHERRRSKRNAVPLPLADRSPVELAERFVCFIQKSVNMMLDSFARHADISLCIGPSLARHR